ncbi:MAG TPA: phytoene/squalene synthase family protein [Flavobacteriales bacterium]
MNTMDLYRSVCLRASRSTTQLYSTSFSIGVRSLHRRFRDPIHAIYGFVRFADEIVDTFHEHDRAALLQRFRNDTHLAIAEGISLNPILHSFQDVVHRYGIEAELYDTFLDSMAMDLTATHHDRGSYERYILGSAEVVGAMCLRVFCEGNSERYLQLKPAAHRLGAAFQKVNFLRDLHDDHVALGRSYFPGVDPERITATDRATIELEITADLDAALAGIRALPKGSRFGVYVAYVYYNALFQRLKAGGEAPVSRVRIPNRRKLVMLTSSYVKHRLDLI